MTEAEARQKNIKIVYFVTTFNEESYDPQSDQDFSRFYMRLGQTKSLPTTSQPSPASYLEVFETIKQAGDEAIVITISSGLSGSIQSAQLAKTMADYEPIDIVDSETAIMAQRILVDRAVELRRQGMNRAAITADLQNYRRRIMVFGALDTLKYLRKGGRIPMSLALIGEMINIKPLIIEKDKKLQMLGMSRSTKGAYKAMLDKIKSETIDLRGPIHFGYTSNLEKGREFMAYVQDSLHFMDADLVAIGPTIGTHVGANGVAIAFVRDQPAV